MAALRCERRVRAGALRHSDTCFLESEVLLQVQTPKSPRSVNPTFTLSQGQASVSIWLAKLRLHSALFVCTAQFTVRSHRGTEQRLYATSAAIVDDYLVPATKRAGWQPLRENRAISRQSLFHHGKHFRFTSYLALRREELRYSLSKMCFFAKPCTLLYILQFQFQLTIATYLSRLI